MRSGRNAGSRIGQFLLFLLLSLITLGLYPLYFMVSRIEEQNELLDDILGELQRHDRE